MLRPRFARHNIGCHYSSTVVVVVTSVHRCAPPPLPLLYRRNRRGGCERDRVYSCCCGRNIKGGITISPNTHRGGPLESDVAAPQSETNRHNIFFPPTVYMHNMQYNVYIIITIVIVDKVSKSVETIPLLSQICTTCTSYNTRVVKFRSQVKWTTFLIDEVSRFLH